jgi:TatD DNase family protein
MLIDTHAHLNFSAFKDDAEDVIKRTLDAGMLVVNVGSQYFTSQRALEYAQNYKGLFAAVGLHPIHIEQKSFQYHDSEELEETEISGSGEAFNFEKYLELAKHPKVVAIGEMGLDYHHFSDEDNIPELINRQREVFLQGIKLANEVEKPMMIHCWGVKSGDHARTDAYEDLYEILKNNPVEKLGIIHSFVGGYKTAKKFIGLGYKIGLNGIITYGISYGRLIREIELKDIVLETDCPYLAPVPKKGERNEPLYVGYVAEKIAEIKQISVEEVSKITAENAEKVLFVS